MGRCTVMNWRGASSSKHAARCASRWLRCTRCSTGWRSAGGCAARGRRASPDGGGDATALLHRERKSCLRFARNGPNCFARCNIWRRRPMPDWQELVGRELAELALEPCEREDVIEELAAHFEEAYDDLRARGLTEDDAAQRCVDEVKNWRELRR